MSICDPDIDLQCEECFEIVRTDCNPFAISVGLTPDDVLFLILSDKNENIFSVVVTVQLDGSIIITPNDFGRDVINKFGTYFFVLSLTLDPIVPIEVDISTSIYKCLSVDFSGLDDQFCGCEETVAQQGIGVMIIESTFIIA